LRPGGGTVDEAFTILRDCGAYDVETAVARTISGTARM
jgi:hypothetical protein